MNIELIKKQLNYDADIIMYENATSSNILAKELAGNGAKEGTVVIVKSQTKGKGRLGRSFISSSENGLYFSIILRPDVEIDACVDITAMASVAVLEAIEETTDKKPKIKWVNDIYINDRKICGILTESAFGVNGNNPEYMICGIGINISPPPNGFDDEIKDIAGSIFEEKYPDGYKSCLFASIINSFFKYYKLLAKGTYLKKYRECSNIIGKEVDVYIGERIINGTAVDITDKAELIIKTEKGESIVVSSGEARVRKRGFGLNEK